MLIVRVHAHIKPDSVSNFRAATIENAGSSVQEPGIARFDVVQQQDDATRFVLIEVYRTPEAAAAHKETAHYAKWRDAVATMMAEPRHSVKYTEVFPNRRTSDAMQWLTHGESISEVEDEEATPAESRTQRFASEETMDCRLCRRCRHCCRLERRATRGGDPQRPRPVESDWRSVLLHASLERLPLHFCP